MLALMEPNTEAGRTALQTAREGMRELLESREETGRLLAPFPQDPEMPDGQETQPWRR